MSRGCLCFIGSMNLTTSKLISQTLCYSIKPTTWLNLNAVTSCCQHRPDKSANLGGV